MNTSKINLKLCSKAVVSLIGVTGAMVVLSSPAMADSQPISSSATQNVQNTSSSVQGMVPLALDGMVTNETTVLVGHSTAGLQIQVNNGGGKIGEGVVGSDGTFKIAIPKQVAGESLQILSLHSDSAANEQLTVSVKDILPKVDPITSDTITGTGLANVNVTLLGDNNQIIDQSVIGPDGHFSLKLATKPFSGMITISSSITNNGLLEEAKSIVQLPVNNATVPQAPQASQPPQAVQTAQEQPVSIDALIGTRTGHGIWTRPYGEPTASYLGDISLYRGTIVHITSLIQSGDVTWYYMQVNGKPIGWIDSRAVDSIPTIDSVNENQLVKRTKDNGVWSIPYGLDGASYIGSTNDYVGKDIKLIQKMSLNGVQWYQFSIDGTVIGWIDSSVLSELTNIQEINQNAVMGVTGTNGIWTMPYGLDGAGYIDSTDAYAYEDIVLVKSAMKDSVQWYEFSLGGQVMGWIDSRALDSTGDANDVNFSVTIGSTYNNGIWSTPYGINGAEYVGSTNDYAFENVQVVKTVQRGNVLWYQIQKDGRLLGWIDSGTSLSDLGNVKDENHPAVIGASTRGDGIWSVPYGEYGATFLGYTDEYSYQPITVIQSITKGTTLWNKIKLGDQVMGWVDASVFSNGVTNISNENKWVLLGDTDGNGIWTVPYGENGANYVGSASNYAGRPIQLVRSLDKDGVHWYYFAVDNQTIGWIDSRVISNATNVQIIDNIGHVSNPNNHAVWSVPYGLQHASYVGSASDFAYKNLHLTSQIDLNGVTWYRFEYNGSTGWIDSRAISIGAIYPLMNVPLVEQRDFTNPLRDLVDGCEITSVTMMLQYAGANVDKVQLANEMPYSAYDPNQGYVGSPYGGGWTIYPPALMNLVRKYAGSAVDLTGQDVESQLMKNHPVVVWMTMHGFSVHAITLTGFDANNIYYNDPWTGEKNASMSKDDFYSNWSTQGRRAISY
ncbi:GW domain-containing glycosaminoglycan-binding protein [Ectobacillus polymachus]|uniref:GW domain-containing glycosaminoglycan-binding protein n=1 Tax=Ectobacillus polymachus TaxID=1508806 RepID=UPI003A8C49CD